MTPAVLATGTLLAAPSDGEDLNSVTVSPGVAGFVAIFVLAVAVVFLAVDMSKRIRRLQARERVAERHRAEDDAAAHGAEDETADRPDDGGAVDDSDAVSGDGAGAGDGPDESPEDPQDGPEDPQDDGPRG